MIVARKRIISKIITTKGNCWIWKGNPRKNGYCRTSYKGKSWYIHRLSYTAFIGKIPDGEDVCHKCDIRACCNPEHLFTGTRRDNMQDAKNKGRVATGSSLPHSKLSIKDKKFILDEIKQNVEYKEIAKKYNVVPGSISRIGRLNGISRKGINKFNREKYEFK